MPTDAELLAAAAAQSPQHAAAIQARLKWLHTARPNQITPPGDWDVWLCMAGRFWGKALALDTPIPTPSGWTTMGQLRAGDLIFADDGAPCRVVRAHDVQIDRKCYAIQFKDGARIVADADHLWFTTTHSSRKAAKRAATPRATSGLKTTAEIAASVEVRTGGRLDYNHCVPACLPLVLPDAELPIAPYVLGVWLGDGSSAGASMTIGDADVDAVRAALLEHGVTIGEQSRKIGTNCAIYWMNDGAPKWSHTRGLAPKLRALGVLRNKHVPPAYLRGSIAQRIALLQGLMDTDGCAANHAATCYFDNTNQNLAEAVFELLVSLGMRPTINERRSVLNGRDCGASWRIVFRPTLDVFRIPRKLARIKRKLHHEKHHRGRSIVSVVEVPSVPVRCITVDSPSRLYLCGKQMIPTHNTRTGAEHIWWRRFTIPESRGAVIAPTSSDLHRVCFEGESGLVAVIPPAILRGGSWSTGYRKSPYPEIHFENGSIIQGFSADEPERLRGPQFHDYWADEAGAWRYLQKAWDMLMFCTRLGDDPNGVVTTTPRPKPLLSNLLKSSRTVISRGSSYDNRANIVQKVFDKVAVYEGTKLGEQEIHGKLLDPSDAGIIKKTWIKQWPAAKPDGTPNPLPKFDFLIMSLDTAFTEKTLDKETGDPDPTGCEILGAFTLPGEKPKDLFGKRIYPPMNVMLLDAWDDFLGFPELVKRVLAELKTEYGAADDAHIAPMIGPDYRVGTGRKIDLVVIEDKGSGISLRQTLAGAGISAYAYNPGNADKLARLHMVSHVFSNGLVWVPEGRLVNKATGAFIRGTGKFASWAEAAIEQWCTFAGEGSIAHDEHVDCASQGIRVLLNHGILLPVKRPDDEPTEGVYARPPSERVNPYAA